MVVNKLLSGSQILLDWFGEGGEPVVQSLSQARADTCNKCPNNSNDAFATAFITKPISKAIKRQMEAKRNLSLTVNGEENLNICRVCLCPLKLKVHTPIQHILSHTSDQLMTEFPEWCWIRREAQSK